MLPPNETDRRPELRRVLLTVFGCHATDDRYSTEHLLAVVSRLLGGPPVSAEVLVAELHSCPFARQRGGNGRPQYWRFVNASSVRPPRKPAGEATPARHGADSAAEPARGPLPPNGATGRAQHPRRQQRLARSSIGPPAEPREPAPLKSRPSKQRE